MSSEESRESASGESSNAGWPAVSRLVRYGIGMLERGERVRRAIDVASCTAAAAACRSQLCNTSHLQLLPAAAAPA